MMPSASTKLVAILSLPAVQVSERQAGLVDTKFNYFINAV